MLPHDYPYIRDVVKINHRLVQFCNRFPGAGPLFILGRRVEHEPGVDLRITARPVVIVADVYDGTNGMIDARGEHGAGGGTAGGPGSYPWPPYSTNGAGEDIPTGPGGDGGGGERGVDGKDGGTVTLMCRRSVNARISVAGGNGTGGGAGGTGGIGVNGYVIPDQEVFVEDEPGAIPPVGHTEFRPGRTVSGTPGGNGGGGGSGGNGGKAGTITFTSIVDDTPPSFDIGGGWGPPGGPGGAPGQDGAYSEGAAAEGSPGAEGAQGAEGQVTHTNVAEAEYPAGLRPLLDSTGPSYANYWAPYRIITGDWYYHRWNPSVPGREGEARLAAVEFDRALELQPDNADALRLKQQLVGVEPPGDAVWTGGGNNALGVPRDLDVLPSFDEYIGAFNDFHVPVLQFLGQGIDTIIAGNMGNKLSEMVELQRAEAAAARDNSSDDVDIAKSEQKLAGDEVTFAQHQLDQATSDIQKALVEMEQQDDEPGVTFGDVVGTMAQVAVAVVGVMAAVPTGGVSLVAMVPTMAALADTVLDDAAPIAKSVFAGEEADTKAVEAAYDKVDKHASAVVRGGKSIVNFVKVVERLSQATTTDNSKYMALVRRGTELTHQLLIARHRAAIAQQRVDAGQSRLARANQIVQQAEALRAELQLNAESIKRAGLLAIATARSKADALLGLAFRAQRSVEIYTLQNEEKNLLLDAGLIHPDHAQDYYEQEIFEGELTGHLLTSWAGMFKPLDIQTDYTSYFDQAHDQDTLRRSFKSADPQLAELKARHQLTFRIDPSAFPAGHFDTKIKSLRLSLVGATHAAGEVSCEVRHDGKYEQRRPDGSLAVQLLKPRISTRPAKLAPLAADEGLGDDPPLTAPRSLAFWGRGVGGDWQVSIPQGQFDSGLDLSGLTEVQVWIGYQFVR